MAEPIDIEKNFYCHKMFTLPGENTISTNKNSPVAPTESINQFSNVVQKFTLLLRILNSFDPFLLDAGKEYSCASNKVICQSQNQCSILTGKQATELSKLNLTNKTSIYTVTQFMVILLPNCSHLSNVTIMC